MRPQKCLWAALVGPLLCGAEPVQNPHGATAAGAEWVALRLAEGRPVVVKFKDGNTTITTRFDYPTRTVHCRDHLGRHVVPWAEWDAAWTGEAYADPLPAAAPALVVVAPPPRLGPGLPQTKPPPPPSNQEIKDGVARPDDRLRYGAYSNGYDYYSDYRAKGGRP